MTPPTQISVKRKPPLRLSHLRKPQEMTPEQWQTALRREFGRQQSFGMTNTGTDPVFSEFRITNPATKGEYRVAIRGLRPGENYCSCPDFAVNTLGTCKHIEFVLDNLQRQRGGSAALKKGFCPPYSEIFVQYGAKREIVFRPGSDCPLGLKKLAIEFFDRDGLLRSNAPMKFDRFLENARQIDPDLRCYPDTLALIAELRDREILMHRVDKLFPDGIRSRAFAHLLKISLYPYQKRGALFAARAGRCLLADDMGLGKTIQAIAAVEILSRAVGIERVLIVSPTSLKHQWKQEIEKFSGRSAAVCEGLLPQRARFYSGDSFYIITNYDVVFRDLDVIRKWNPDVIILDEAQRIKNWKTRTAKTIKKLESKYAIVLTGTPLENRLEELHSIVEFVDRFRLGPSFAFLAAHQHLDEAGKVIGYRNLGAISETLKPILLRRTKTEVLKELPERIDKNYFVPMTAEQRSYHEENREIAARIIAKWRKIGFLTESDQRRLQIALQYMRMSCNSTYLLDQKTDFGVKADEFMTVLNEMFETPDTKVVVFSQWLRTHELLEWRLEKGRHKFALFHGGIPGRQRKDLIRRFKEDDRCRIFLSTDAGGVGLNLQNASAVVNMDLPWNPAVLEQRIGRVHRLGQHRPVRVVNFIAQGTIEQGMLGLLSFKKSLFAGILESGQDEVFLGGSRLKRFMESVETATAAAAQIAPMPPAEKTPEPTQESPRKEEVAAATAAPIQAQPVWQELLSAGASWLTQIAQSLQPGTRIPAETARPAGSVTLDTDPATGQSSLRIPLPNRETMDKILGVLSEVLTKIK